MNQGKIFFRVLACRFGSARAADVTCKNVMYDSSVGRPRRRRDRPEFVRRPGRRRAYVGARRTSVSDVGLRFDGCKTQMYDSSVGRAPASGPRWS